MEFNGVSSTADVQVTSAQQPSTGQPNPVSQLERLAALRQGGALTDAEFDEEKRKILGDS